MLLRSLLILDNYNNNVGFFRDKNILKSNKKQKHYTAKIIQIKDGWNFKTCKLIKYMPNCTQAFI